MALRKAVNPSLLRRSVSPPTLCRSLSRVADQGVEKDCRRETASGFRGESSAFVKWASGFAFVGGLGLLHFGGWNGNAIVADCESNEVADKPSASKKRSTGCVLRDSYRRRVFFNYEKRIRLRSSPEKVFLCAFHQCWSEVYKIIERRLKSGMVLEKEFQALPHLDDLDDASWSTIKKMLMQKPFAQLHQEIQLSIVVDIPCLLKVFEYFASIQGPDGESLMTPADLMRAVVPVFPPSDSDVVRDGCLRGERPPGELICSPSTFFKLFDIDEDGLISFPEYIFFVTLLSVPDSDVSAAFKMLDLDHDGEIDREEFRKVMNLMRTKHRQGAAHRDGCRTGFKVGQSVENGGLLKFFFGKDGSCRLQLVEFEKFIRNLHEEIIRLEFEHYDYQSRGSISAKDFALSMVAAADMNRINQYLDRVDAMSNDPALNNIRITREEFWRFVELRRKLGPLASAMYTYGKVYGLLTKADFQRAATHVCDVPITGNLVDVVFHIFDTSKDGNLSIDEFLGVLDRREYDITYPRESGIIHLLTCWWDCAKDCHSKWLCS